MQLKNLFADEDAVSPVIGVILMVAITVILAAVIGAFVLGIGGSQEQVPQASWEFDSNNQDDINGKETISITHRGGEEMDSDLLSVSVGGEEVYASSSTSGKFSFAGSNDAAWKDSSIGITAGDTLQIQDDEHESSGVGEIEDGEKIVVVWSSSSSESTSIIGTGTVAF